MTGPDPGEITLIDPPTFASAENLGPGVPTARAGPGQPVTSRDLVQLDGTASSDPEGEPLTYDWTQVTGPIVTLSGADTATPTFTAPAVDFISERTLEFQLEVCDPGSLCGTDTVVITVEPLVDATGIVILDGPVSSMKTSKSFVFKVTNVGTALPHAINESNITSSVDVNGTPTGSVTVSPFMKILNPGASTRVKLAWSYPAGSLVTGDSVVFHACVNVAGDIDTTNDCDDATATAK